MNRGINLGSGNQHFDSTDKIEWLNMDLDDRDGVVEIAGDVSKELPFFAETFDIMVASHIVEHIEMSIVGDVIKDWMRCLKPGGKLLITVPNARALAEAYVTKNITNYIFAVNMTGPYHNSVADHHRWCYDYEELADRCKGFNIEVLTPENMPEECMGKVALDWWILGVVLTK